MIRRKRLVAVRIEEEAPFDTAGLTDTQIEILRIYRHLNREGRKLLREKIMSLMEEYPADKPPGGHGSSG